MSYLLSKIRELLLLLGGTEVNDERAASLISRRHHSPHFVRYRRNIINKRVQIISALFVVLNLTWIAVDWALLPSEIALPMSGYRVLSSVIFLFLALYQAEENESYTWRLWLLFLNPLVFYLLALNQLQGVELQGWGGVLVEIYKLLPFIITTGVSVFPLTLIEGVSLGLVALASMLLGSWIVTGASEFFFMSTGWILLLMLGVTILATLTQLHFMFSLLHRISYDNLTGVFSRDTGREMIDLYFRLSLDQEAPFALAFVDLDHFKSINDNYGHDEGDEILKKAAASLQHHFRRGDIVVRWGGEEFLVVFPNTDLKGLKEVLGRLMEDWLGERPDGKPLTASIGVAERISDDVTDWPQLLELADKRMYLAKDGGRARAVLVGDEELSTNAQ